MTDIAPEVLDEIRRVAKAELDFERSIEPSDLLQGDLQFDSMAMIVVAVALENRFRVKLMEEDAGGISSVDDLVKLVCRRVAEQAAP